MDFVISQYTANLPNIVFLICLDDDSNKWCWVAFDQSHEHEWIEQCEPVMDTAEQAMESARHWYETDALAKKYH